MDARAGRRERRPSPEGAAMSSDVLGQPQPPLSGVTPPADAQAGNLCEVCGKPRSARSDFYCSRRCKDRAYNAAHPVARQRTLPLTPEPLRVHTPPHNPALVHKLKPAALNVLGLLSDGQPHSRHELYQVGGTRYSARVEEIRAAGHRVLGPSKSIRWRIYECEPAGPGELEMYRLAEGERA